METREYGFMGEPFPSKKFQKTMIDYREGVNKPSYDELYQEAELRKAALASVVQGILDCFGNTPPKAINGVVTISEEKFTKLVSTVNKCSNQLVNLVTKPLVSGDIKQ